MDGICFLIIIAYVYTFDTCFNLLRCATSSVHTNNFNDTELHSLVRTLLISAITFWILNQYLYTQVYFYDGSVTCYEDEHYYICSDFHTDFVDFCHTISICGGCYQPQLFSGTSRGFSHLLLLINVLKLNLQLSSYQKKCS